MIVLFVFLFVSISASDYYVVIHDDGPVVIGAEITFRANLYSKDGDRPVGMFKYKWRDNANPQHHKEFMSDYTSNWTVSYLPHTYEPGLYKVEVEVFTPTIIIDWPECSKRKSFELTSLLNGELYLRQNNATITSDYISNATEVIHDIQLNSPDLNFLKNASFIETFWYLDCKFISKTNDLKLPYNYTESDVLHYIDVLVIASLEPKPNSTTASDSHHDIESSTEILLINGSKADDIKSSDPNLVNNTKFSYYTMNNGSGNGSTIPGHPEMYFDCTDKHFSPTDAIHSYGLFSRKIKVKAPVSNLRAEGNNWLQSGDVLNLKVWCNGSAPFSYCIQYWNGNYTVTGNESCISKKIYLSTCNFQVTHYFGNSTNYTVVIIVENDVQKMVRGVNVIVYEVTKHAQLSVIIVPVSASIAAVILIVFGIAYYVQSRNRYIVEVADFDFSNASDMEYKTFSERLVEAVSNAFNKTEDYSEQDSGNGVPTNRKYGSMQ